MTLSILTTFGRRAAYAAILGFTLMTTGAFAQTILTERSSDIDIQRALERSAKPLAPGKTISVVPESESVEGASFTIEFEFDSARLTKASERLVRRIARIIMNDDDLSEADFLIDGHTDAVGSDSYNMKLGAARARTVLQALADYGISKRSMRARSFGESELYDPIHPKSGVNRRVEITPYL